jgi:hypothetical protein
MTKAKAKRQDPMNIKHELIGSIHALQIHPEAR